MALDCTIPSLEPVFSLETVDSSLSSISRTAILISLSGSPTGSFLG